MAIQIRGATAIAGLGTFNAYATVNGLHVISCDSKLPLNSNLTITIQQNGSTLATFGGATNNPSPTQKNLFGKAYCNAAVGDALTVVLSSSALADQVPNAINSLINVVRSE